MPSRAVAYVDLTVSQVLELLVSSIACEPASYVLSVAHCLPLAVSVCATLHVYEAALCDQTYQVYLPNLEELTAFEKKAKTTLETSLEATAGQTRWGKKSGSRCLERSDAGFPAAPPCSFPISSRKMLGLCLMQRRLVGHRTENLSR